MMAELLKRDQFERDFAGGLSKLSNRQRRELERLLGDPPDPARVPSDFWARVQRETEEELAALILLVMAAAAVQHGLADAEAQVLASAQARARQVAADYAAHSRDMLAGGADLVTIFGPPRIEGIAVTEVTVGASVGGEIGVGASVGLSEDDLWITEADPNVCPICHPLHKKPRSLWSRNFPQGPPAHPR